MAVSKLTQVIKLAGKIEAINAGIEVVIAKRGELEEALKVAAAEIDADVLAKEKAKVTGRANAIAQFEAIMGAK